MNHEAALRTVHIDSKTVKIIGAGGGVPLSDRERRDVARLTKVRRSGISSIRNRRDKLSRNAPCPCGSGQKLKACHGANPRAGRPPLYHELSQGQRDALCSPSAAEAGALSDPPL